MDAEDLQLSPKIAMRDNDTKFTAQFDEVFQTSGVEIKRTVPLSPNLRAHVERFIQTLKVECLDKFVIVAQRHLNSICREWQSHYNRERPHEARNNLPPDFQEPGGQTPGSRLHDTPWWAAEALRTPGSVSTLRFDDGLGCANPRAVPHDFGVTTSVTA